MSMPPRPLAALIVVVALISGCGAKPSQTSGAGSNTAASARQAMQFAACMRSHGVTSFPDPGASGKFTIDGVVNGSSLNPNAPAFKQAMSACKKLEPAGFTGPRVTPRQRTARLKFAQCVRDSGVPDFPDPTPDGPLVDTNRIPSSATTSGMSTLHAAMRKCGAIYSGELGLRSH
jgi:hypothetical protein